MTCEEEELSLDGIGMFLSPSITCVIRSWVTFCQDIPSKEGFNARGDADAPCPILLSYKVIKEPQSLVCSRGRKIVTHGSGALTAADVCCLQSFIWSVKSTAVNAPD